jgi:hypothetical protein
MRYNDNLKFLSFFREASKLKCAIIDEKIKLCDQDITELVSFFSSKSKLEDLHLSSNLAGIFKVQENIANLAFQLKQLNINFRNFSDLHYKNFNSFLVKQKSLEVLQCSNMKLPIYGTIKLIINGLKKLKEVHFKNCALKFDVHEDSLELTKNLIIKNASFNYAKNCDIKNLLMIMKAIPALSFLRLSGFPENQLQNILEALKSSFVNLQTIEFFKCHLPVVQLRQVQEASFVLCDTNGIEKFLNCNNFKRVGIHPKEN